SSTASPRFTFILWESQTRSIVSLRSCSSTGRLDFLAAEWLSLPLIARQPPVTTHVFLILTCRHRLNQGWGIVVYKRGACGHSILFLWFVCEIILTLLSGKKVAAL